MKKVTEDYITFEQAKLLKEKGFPQWPVEDNSKNAYNCTGELCPIRYFVQNQQDYYSAATLSLVQKWLREEKDIYILICHVFENRLCKPIGFVADITYKNLERYVYTTVNSNNSSVYQKFDTYEQALSAGIDKAIKLI